MYETPDDLQSLQALLDRSFARSGGHLTSIMEPHRRLTAARLVQDLGSIAVLNVATVTAAGLPRISAVDGHFLRGRWYFGTAAGAVKTVHLRARPGISAAYTPRDGYGVFCHGTAIELAAGADGFAMLDEHLNRAYGHGAEGWTEEVAFFRIEPDWMTGFAMTEQEMAGVSS